MNKVEENKISKNNIFKKMYYSIFKFEKYPEMAAEGLKEAIKYLTIIIAIVSVFIVIGSVIEMNKLVNNLASYINENIPEFTYENGEISTENTEPIIISDIKYNGIDKIIIDTSAKTDEEKTESKTENDIVGTNIYFFKNQIVLRSKTENDEVTEAPYTYDDFIKNYTQENIKTFNKTQLIEYMTSAKMNNYYMRYGMSLTVYLIIANILVALLNTIELAILGWITAITARVRIRFVALYNMAVYSLTLPVLLNIIYVIINYFTKFTISYFQVAYMTIAYIYLAATIFILKDDIVKKQEEVSKIKEEQKKVREEIKEQERKEEQPKKENKKKDKKEKEDDKGEEPDASEA